MNARFRRHIPWLLTATRVVLLARKWQVVSPGMRRFDSVADTLFCLALVAAIWVLAPQVLIAHRPLAHAMQRRRKTGA